MEKQELVKIDFKEFGLQETKANEIASQFKPMLDKMVELENEYNDIIQLPIEDSETAVKAKELRLKYVKVRTGTAAIHKEQKAFYLAGGRFVDGWKNAQLFASQGKEEKLMDIEKYQERLEAERITKLSEDRANEIKPYLPEESPEPVDLGYMADDVWNNYLLGAKSSFEARKEAERKAEEERIAAEKKAEEERIEKERLSALKNERENILKPYWSFVPDSHPSFETLSDSEWNDFVEEMKNAKSDYDKKQAEIAAENERLKKEQEAAKAKAEEERKERERLAKIEAEKQAKIEAERKAKEAKERAEYEAKIKAEQEAKAKLEAELKAKAEAERKAKEEAEKQHQLELQKGDSDKFNDLLSDLESLKTKYSFKSEKNIKMYNDVCLLIDKVILHIKK